MKSSTNNLKKSTYRIPIRYLNGNPADMLFWDAVYYLLETEGKTDSQGTRQVETSNNQLVELTGLSKKAIGDQEKIAIERDNLQDGGSGWGAWSYILELRDYEALLSKDVVEKPVSYVKEGWLRNLHTKNRSRFPLAVINFFFTNETSIKTEELVEGCKHPERKTPPDSREIDKVLTLFKELGLIEPDETGAYRLIKKRFETKADLAWKQRRSAIGVMYVSQPNDDRRIGNEVKGFKKLTIGRSRRNDIVIHSGYGRVSGKHARLESRLRAIRLYDANSKHKTFVNKEEVDSEAGRLLQDGDIIYLGGEHDGGCQITVKLLPLLGDPESTTPTTGITE